MTLRRQALTAVTHLALLGHCGFAGALGLGEIKLNSALNEPLDAEIPLVGAGEVAGSEVIVTLANQAEFDRAGVEREFFLLDLQFTVDAKSPKGAVVRVTSRKAVKEPYLDFLVNLHWSGGQVLREYTMLLDPPVFADDRSAAPARAARADAQAPRHAASVPPAAADGDGEYRVARGDTLWEIARKVGPADASVQQTMVAIQALNPHAFINGNINLLVSGQLLRLPDAAGVHDVDPRRALGQVAEQTRAWQSATPAQGAPLDARPMAASATDSGTASDELRLAAPGPGAIPAGGAGTGLSGVAQLALAREEIDRVTRENQELKQKLANLEEQLQTSARLAEIASDPARAAQLAAQRAGEEGDTAAASPAAPATAAMAANDRKPEAGAAPANPPTESPTDATEPQAPSPADGAGTQAAAVPADGGGETAPVAAPTVSEAGVAQPAEAVASTPAAAVAPAPSTPPGDTSTAEPGEGEGSGGLLAALQRHLLAILAVVGAAALAVIGLALRKRDADTGATAELPRFEGTTAVTRAGTAAQAPLPSIDTIELDQADLLFASADTQAADGRSAAAPATELTTEEAERRLAALSEELTEERRAAAAGEAVTEPVDLEFEPLELEPATMEIPAQTWSSTEARASGAGSPADLAPEEPEIDFDRVSLDVAPSGSPSVMTDTVSLDEFDIDALLDADLAPTKAEQVTNGEFDLNADFSLDEDLEMAGSDGAVMPSTDASVFASDDFDLEKEFDLENEFDFADDQDPMATQLELAQAYAEMDDAAGAKEILADVIARGSPEQQQKARSLLQAIG